MNGEDRRGATPSGEERRTAGAPVRQPAFKIPPITLALAVAIAAAYAVLSLGPLWLADAAYKYLTVVPARVALVVVDPGRSDTALAVLSLVSHAFIHFQGMHFALNLAFLVAFGSGCERVLGWRRYVGLVLASTVAGALAQLVADWGEVIFMFGASGMVSGCMGAIIRLMLALPQRRRQALVLLAVLLLFNGVFAAFGPALLGIDAQIAWQAHLGGFAAGLLLGYPPRRRIV